MARSRSYGGKRVLLKSVYFAWAIRRHRIGHVHAHFGWTATDAARIVLRLTGVGYSFSLHAADIYFVPDQLAEKLDEASLVLTCVGNNATYLRQKFGPLVEDKLKVVYHGVDLEMFNPGVEVAKDIDILCVSNLVEKKGHRYLLEACRRLKHENIHVKCLIVGDGPEREPLSEMIAAFGLAGDVAIVNRRPHGDLPSLYAISRLFVLPSIITGDGDRDGIPNVLVEAMAMGVPVVSSNLPNIAELVEDGRNGRLVQPRDSEALTQVLRELLSDGTQRQILGHAGRETVMARFDARVSIVRVAALFRRFAPYR